MQESEAPMQEIVTLVLTPLEAGFLSLMWMLAHSTTMREVPEMREKSIQKAKEAERGIKIMILMAGTEVPIELERKINAVARAYLKADAANRLGL